MGQLKKGNRKFNLVFPEQMFDDLQEIAEKKGLTASAVIRMLVAAYLLQERR